MKYLFIVVTVAASALFLALSPGGGGRPAQASVSTSILPDLVVTGMSVEFEPGITCNWSGHSLGTRVWVHNIGNAGTGPFVVEYVVGTNSYQKTLSSGLAATQYASVWFPAYSYSWEEVTATADATFQVTESDETNNSLSEILPVPTPPPTCTPGPSPTPTRTPTVFTRDPVGGIADLPGAAAGPAETGATENDSSRAPYLAIAGAAAGIVVIGTGGWYAGKRRRGY